MAEPIEGKVEVEKTWDDNQIGSYAAILWLPNPESRSGWADYFVRKHGGRDRDNASKPRGKGMGF